MGAGEVPTETIGSSSIRVPVGTGWGLESPVRASSPLVLAEIRVEPDSPVPIAADHGELAVLALAGDIEVVGDAVPCGSLAVLRPGVPTTLRGSGTAMVMGGEPVGPRHIWWNFVPSDAERIEQAKADWAQQRFPVVPGDHHPWVPLPGGP